MRTILDKLTSRATQFYIFFIGTALCWGAIGIDQIDLPGEKTWAWGYIVMAVLSILIVLKRNIAFLRKTAAIYFPSLMFFKSIDIYHTTGTASLSLLFFLAWASLIFILAIPLIWTLPPELREYYTLKEEVDDAMIELESMKARLRREG